MHKMGFETVKLNLRGRTFLKEPKIKPLLIDTVVASKEVVLSVFLDLPDSTQNVIELIDIQVVAVVENLEQINVY